MDERISSIFTESTEDMGLMYASYLPLLNVTEKFLNTVQECISDLLTKPFDVKIDLSKEISQYKKDVSVKFKAEPIDIRKIKSLINKVKAFNSDMESLLSKYVRLKDKIAFGGNYFRAIIQKPKVYSKEMDEKSYDRVNNNIRNVNRAMDWIEKVMIDLLNMADQDLNILTIVNRVYAKKHIYESLPNGVKVEDVADNIGGMLPGAKDPKAEPFNETAPWVVNTRDKKTGTAATYISRNHDMASYGEEDPPSSSEEEDKEKSLEDYRRPSADADKSTAGTIEDDTDNEENNTDDKVPNGVNNYYYYTYNNSLNRNTGSFNRDNSTHDDHSSHYRNIRDDHSTGKQVNSNNSTGTIDNGKKDEENEFHSLESVKPWELSDPASIKLMEAVGDADDNKPQSDHPVKDTLMDIDRNLTKHQQNAKRAVQNIQNVGRAAMKPVNRTKDWISKLVGQWKDADETNIKEKMADPHARSNLFSAIKKAVMAESLLKAGLLLNPVFLFLTVTRGIGKNKKEFRIRNEMIGELKTEIEIVKEKIKDADSKGDNKAKYQLMRFENELNKKLLRVGGGKGWSKIL